MWFLGLLAGMVVGGMIGHGFGAFAGAVLGAIAGAAYRSAHPAGTDDAGASTQRLAEIERKIEHIYKSLEDIHWRLRKIEEPGAVAGPRPLDAAQPVAQSTADVKAAAAMVHEEVVRVSETLQHAGATIDQAPVSAAVAAHEPAATVESVGLETSAAQIRRIAEASARTRIDTATPEATAEADLAPEESASGEPSLWQRLLSGNIVAKAGAVILFFGVGFLLKYAYDHAVLPVPVRLAGVALAGIAMLVGGWRLLSQRRLYGLILQGAGIGVLYLDVFFALRVFALIHPTIGFALFMLLGIAATLLAVRQDAKVLAILGLTGAFLAPVLASSGSGQHVVLFSYYTLLNGFILAISWFKAWRDLNLTGFVFTFIVGVFWGQSNYRPELFATVEPFVLIFFAMYLVIPILFAQRQPPQLKRLVDGTLVFGTPLSVAFMQAGLVREMPYGLAWSAGVGAALYALLAFMVMRRAGMRLLGEAYVALAVVLATMAVFFALDAYPTFALWTLEGSAIVWIGLRQQRFLARLFGILLQFAGALLFLSHYNDYDRAQPWLNDFILGCGLIAAAGVITAWLMHKHREVLIEGGDDAATVILVWAVGWWFAGGLHALHDGLPQADFHGAALIFASATFALAETVGGWLDWVGLRRITLGHLPVIVLGIVGGGTGHPLAGLGAVAWPLNFAVFFWCLHWQANDGIATTHGVRYRFGWILLAWLATWEALWLFRHRYFGWSLLMGMAGIAAGALRYRLREHENPSAASISSWALLWGLGFWLASGLAYIDWRHDPDLHIAYGLGFVVGTAFLGEIIGGWIAWPALRRAQLLLLPAMAVALIMQIDRHLHPSADDAWMAWAGGLAALFYCTRRQQRDDIAVAPYAQYTCAVWLATGLVAWECAWQLRMEFPQTGWSFAAWGAVPAIALVLLTRFGARFAPWGENFGAFRSLGLGPLAVYGVLWSLLSSANPSNVAPWIYLPLANPVDLAQIATLLALRAWWRADAAPDVDSMRRGAVLAAIIGFAWLNCILLRSVHHWFGVPYELDDMFRSVVVQSALSILWTLTALVLMVLATRRAQRPLWLAGAVLLTMVVGKLFLLDLANSGTVERIVSFLGVGVLLMIIGYAAPLPPGETETQSG